MARRRMLGFGPEKHGDLADKAADIARSEFRRAEQAAKSGQCSMALSTYGYAREQFGVAAAESWAASGGKQRLTGEDFPQWDSALSSFRKNCLVGGGLSGMRRRRSRR